MKTQVSIVLVCCILSVNTAIAQERFSGEFRPFLNFPLEKLEEKNLGVGFGFEMEVAYKMMPHLKAYAGFGWSEFKTEANFQETSTLLNETFFPLGFELTFPVSKAPLTYYGQVGAVLENVSLEDLNTGVQRDSGYGVGWQIGIGVEYVFTEYWSLKPEIGYRSFSKTLQDHASSTKLDLNYISLSVGIQRAF
ncbi:MAG: outer membrane beta-barrel protein [Bacteroidota bacterium]